MSTRKPPDLIQLYIKSCAIGFMLSAVFVSLLLGFDILGLGGLVARSDIGTASVLMMWILHGVIFAAVQFGLMMMGMADDDDDDDHHGGRCARVFLAEPVPIRVDRSRPNQRR